MKVTEMKSPQFLKKLSVKELEKLSIDIRNFILENVSKTGGHLSSNLGVVDLTIALHKVFDFKKDKIIFDVGHQCYTHKILTGRANKFNTLRQYKGLSGFQKRNESIYDCYEAGHSSTSISAAIGFAIARDNEKKKYDVIALIGDGSISNGLSYEALNHLGSLKTKVIVILNDNNMSISKNIGSVHNMLDKIRFNKKYDESKNKTKLFFNKIPLIGKPLINITSLLKESFKTIYLKEGLNFKDFGIDYYGPINGHDYEEMLKYFSLAKKSNKSVILHVITEKGKGYLPALNDKVGLWHGVGPFNIETGLSITKSNGLFSFSEIVSKQLVAFGKRNNDLFVITPAMECGSNLSKYKELYPKRYIDVGIAEEHALVLASSLALSNKKVFVSIYSTFLQRGYDAIIHDIARLNSPVVIGIDRCGLVGEDGETHHGIYDVSFLMHIPNLIIAHPRNCKESCNLIYTALKSKSPFCIRYSKNKYEYSEYKPELLSVGSWEVLKNGKDATIIAYGDFVENALKVSELVNNKKIGVVNARYIKPFDKVMFDKLLSSKKTIIVYEEVIETGSLGSVLIHYANSHGYKNKIIHIAIKESYVEHGSRKLLLKNMKLDVESVVDFIKNNI